MGLTYPCEPHSPEMFLFVDKTGDDNTIQKYSYSVRVKPPKQYYKRSSHVYLLLHACQPAGLLDVKNSHKNGRCEVFYGLVQTHLLPQLME